MTEKEGGRFKKRKRKGSLRVLEKVEDLLDAVGKKPHSMETGKGWRR